MSKKSIIFITEEEFMEADENNDGFCLSCGEQTDGGVEPDALRYKCEVCEKNSVYGAQECLMMGYIEFIDPREE